MLPVSPLQVIQLHQHFVPKPEAADFGHLSYDLDKTHTVVSVMLLFFYELTDLSYKYINL